VRNTQISLQNYGQEIILEAHEFVPFYWSLIYDTLVLRMFNNSSSNIVIIVAGNLVKYS